MGRIIGIVLLVILTGCSANWHIKKAIKKDPSILETKIITVRDTVETFTNRVEVDSVFMVSNDTVVIVKDNLTIKHWIHQDSVYIDGVCDSIFVRVPYEVQVPVETIRFEKKSPLDLILRWIPAILLVLIIIYFVKNLTR